MKRTLTTSAFLTAISVLCISAGMAIGHEGEDKDLESAQAVSAKVTMEEAIQKAKAKFPGSVVESELEAEDATLVYEVEIVSASGDVQEIEIDAQSGVILGSETEHAEDEDDTHETDKS